MAADDQPILVNVPLVDDQVTWIMRLERSQVTAKRFTGQLAGLATERRRGAGPRCEAAHTIEDGL